MKMFKANQKKIFTCLGLIMTLVIFLVPNFVAAQDISLGIEYASALQLGTRDIREMVIAIVNVLLGLLGIIAILIILYGGYVWMTAGGSPERISFAKKVIINGVIGFIIIIAAFAIVNFIINMLEEASAPVAVCTSGETEPCSNIGVCEREKLCTNGQWGSCYFTDPSCDPFPPESFYLTDTSPHNGDELPIRNVMVSLYFSHNVQEENFETAVTIEETQTGNPVDLIVELSATNPKKVEIRPSTPCPDPYGYEYCFDPLVWYTVTVIPNDPLISFLSAVNGQPVNCQLGAPCTFEFKTGSLIDTLAPDANLTKAEGALSGIYDPWNNILNISYEDEYTYWSLGEDESAVAAIEFFEPANNLIGVDTPPAILTSYEGQSGIPAPPYGPWNPATLGYVEGDVVSIKSVVGDYAGHSDESIKQVKLWPGHCFNNSCDPGESCYTNPSLPINCGVECLPCEGESCSTDPLVCTPDNNLCASNICLPPGAENECTCFPMPVIQDFDPIDGAPGTFVTISGQHFGDNQGQVWFVDLSNQETLARFPSAVVAECDDTWSDTQVIVELPLSLVQGEYYYIKLATNDPTYGSLVDTTINNNGPVLNNFLVNNVERPGLCQVAPDSGVLETPFDLYGVNFVPTGYSINFGLNPSVPANNQTYVTQNHLQGTVPNVNPGNIPIIVAIGSLQSNPINFTVTSAGYAGNPFITNFTPISGPSGQYVTIYGGNFGNYVAGQSSVEFNGIPVNFGDFPDECGTDFWHDDFVVVKVPTDPGMNSGPITLIRDDGERATSADDFAYDPSAPLLPGICSLYPQEGQWNDPVEIVGEYFEDSSVNFSTIVLTEPPDLGGPGEADIFEVDVPDNSQTGDVLVQNNANPTIASGPWPFIVIEGEPTFTGNFGYYQWQFETCADCYVPQVLENPSCFNQLASPTPPNSGAGNTAANIDSVLGVRFNVNMANPSFVYNYSGQANPSYIIQQCNGDGSIENLPFDENSCQSFVWTGQAPGYPLFDDNTPEYVKVRPANNFLTGYWYRVVLTNGLVSEAEGYPLGENLNFDLDGDSLEDSFEWHFRTRLTAEACEPDTAAVEPASRLENPDPLLNNPLEVGQTVNYSAAAQNSATCAICPDNFIWNWQSDHPSQAQINPAIHASINPLYANGTIRQPDVGIITAETSQYLNGDPLPMTLIDTAELNIVPASPYIEFSNVCDENVPLYPSPNPYDGLNNVCRNAILQARFVNSQGYPIAMDTTTLTNSNITVEDQYNNQITGQITANLFGFTFMPDNFLGSSLTYNVTLDDVYSLEQMPLVGPNGWSFTTGDEICDELSSVQVFPTYKLFQTVPDSENYIANLVGDQCILLYLPNTSWSWLSNNPAVASVTGSVNQNEIVTAVGEGETSVEATAVVNANSYTGSGEVEVVLTPITPLTITDHQPQNPPPVCLNSIVRIDFSEPIQIGVNDPPQFLDAVSVAGGTAVVGEWTITGNGLRYEFTPDSYLNSNTAYLVYVKGGNNGVVSQSGNKHLGQAECQASQMTWNANAQQCFWYFTTGDELCEVESIFVNVLDVPTTTEATVYEGESTGWLATAFSESGDPLANPMDGWTADEPTVANLQAHPSYPTNSRYQLTTGAIDRSIFGTTTVATDLFAYINETVNQAHVTSTPSHLTVLPILAGPSVIETKPIDGSENVCLNSLISVKFDKHLDEATVNNSNFKISYNTSTEQIVSTVEDGILVFDGNNLLTKNGTLDDVVNPGLEDFMIESWIKTTQNSRQIIYERNYEQPGWWFEVASNGKIRATINHQGETSIWSSDLVSNGVWHHVAAIFNRDGNGQIYIDGIPNGSPVSIVSKQNVDIRNGRQSSIGGLNSPGAYFNGSIASVRLYRFGINGLPANIADLISYNYHNPTSVSPNLTDSAAALWELGEGEGTVALDTSGNGFDLPFASGGTLTPPQWGTDSLPVKADCEGIIAGFTYQQKKTNGLFNSILARFINSFIGQLFNSLYNLIFENVQAQQNYTGFWCSIDSYGEWTMENSIIYSTVKFNLNQLLPASAPIRVKVVGGEDGVKSEEGWPLYNPNAGDDFVYIFETGNTYCELSFVTVSTDVAGLSNQWLFLTPEDNQNDNVTDPANANFDSIYDSDKVYYAHGFTVDGQELQRVPGVPPFGYGWTWSWSSASPAIASILYSDNENSYSIVGAENNPGETEITVSADFSPVYQTESLTADGLAIVDLCQNPWPERETGSIEVPEYIDEDYSFSLRYCRDAGGPGTSDDLPALDESQFIEDEFINSFTSNATPEALLEDELLREYLIPVPTTGDVIGLRIYENAFHLTPLGWYQENVEVQGSPITQTVDGYPAIQDGRTTYVGAANGILTGHCTNIQGPPLFCTPYNIPENCGDCIIDDAYYYTNIYLLSYNQSPAPQTTQIVNQLLENWEFNINVESELKPKLVNDMDRLTGLTTIANALDNYQQSHNANYPLLSSGTFVPGMSTSKWPSWTQTLGPAIGSSMPTDPINTFNGCIDCEEPNLTNGGFEEAPAMTGWSDESGVNISTTTEPQFVHQGNNAAVIASNMTNKGIISDLISLIPNTTYEINAWVYLESPNRAQLNFLLAPGDNYGNQWFTPPDYTGWFQLKNRLITNSTPADPVTMLAIRSFAGSAVFYADEVVLQTAGGNCGYDPQTCWNPEGNSGQGAFACDDGSYIYSYQNLATTNYRLSTKMEATADWWPQNTPTIKYIDTHIDLSMTNVAVCTTQVLAGVCGDNFVFPPEQCEPGMSNSFCTPGFSWYTPGAVGCDPLSCQWLNFSNAPGCNASMNINQCCGGYCGDAALNTSPAYNVSVPEQCDYNAQWPNSGFANGQPQYSSVTSQYFCSSSCQESGGWCGNTELDTPWEGCDTSAPSGYQGFGNGTASFDQYACGTSGPTSCQDTEGWCGDASLQTPYGEQCDKGAASGASWAHGNPSLATGSSMQYGCTYNCQDTGGWCGDSTIQSLYEECDGTLGTSGWDCTGSATVSCPAPASAYACQRYCSSGCLYQGECGNNVVEGTPECSEVCDGTATPPHTQCQTDCTDVQSCISPWIYCDGSWSDADGCEVNPQINLFNCGSCGNVCNYTGGHGAPACNSGSCEIQCDVGYHCSSSTYPNYTTVCPMADTCLEDAVCGDGVIDPGEICDDGINNGLIGFCNTDCTSIEGLGDPIFFDDFEDPVFTTAHWQAGFTNGGTASWSVVEEVGNPENHLLMGVDDNPGTNVWSVRDYRVIWDTIVPSVPIDLRTNYAILTQIDFGDVGEFDNWDAMILLRRGDQTPNVYTATNQEYYAWWNDFWIPSSPSQPVTCPLTTLPDQPSFAQIRRTNFGTPTTGTPLVSDSPINCGKFWILVDINNISATETLIRARWWQVGTQLEIPIIWDLEYTDSSPSRILGPGYPGLGNWNDTTFYYDNFGIYESQPFY